jgi:hypothetical protein
MSGHGLSVLEQSAIIEIGSNAGRAKSVITNYRGNAGLPHAALQHALGID